MDEPTWSEGVRRQMLEVRAHLDEDLVALFRNARIMVDWRQYVKDYPWLAVGAAAAAGFLVVPTRRKTMTLDAHRLADLSRQKYLVVQTSANGGTKGGLVDTIIAMAVSALSREATAWVATLLGQWATRRSAQGRRESDARHYP